MVVNGKIWPKADVSPATTACGCSTAATAGSWCCSSSPSVPANRSLRVRALPSRSVSSAATRALDACCQTDNWFRARRTLRHGRSTSPRYRREPSDHEEPRRRFAVRRCVRLRPRSRGPVSRPPDRPDHGIRRGRCPSIQRCRTSSIPATFLATAACPTARRRGGWPCSRVPTSSAACSPCWARSLTTSAGSRRGQGLHVVPTHDRNTRPRQQRDLGNLQFHRRRPPRPPPSGPVRDPRSRGRIRVRHHRRTRTTLQHNGTSGRGRRDLQHPEHHADPTSGGSTTSLHQRTWSHRSPATPRVHRQRVRWCESRPSSTSPAATSGIATSSPTRTTR